MPKDWDATNRAILEKLNIREVYRELGVEVVGGKPNRKGWVACKAVGREDRNPSAAICVEGGPLGRYRDLGGEGDSYSLWDFAALHGPYADWKSARKAYAKAAGVKLGRGGATDRPDDQLAFQVWNEMLCSAWCRHKQGVTPEAVRKNGGRLAKMPKKAKVQHPVIAIPIYGPQLADADPTGWVVFHRAGKMLPVFQGKGVPPSMVKMKTVKHSKSGWMGLAGLLHLEEAEVVWKVEGVPDMLALYAAIPAELRGKHVVITNSGGCSEIPKPELLELLGGKTVYVVHDADKPGQGTEDGSRASGAKLWCREIATFAKEVRNVQLPYPIAEKHGPDVRDYLNEGNQYSDLLNLAAAAEVYVSSDGLPDGTESGSEPSGESGPGPGSGENAGKTPPPDRLGGDSLQLERAICEALQIDVIGELENGKIKLFSRWHRKSDVIKDVSRWTNEKMLQFCGPPARDAINVSNEYVPNQYTVQQIRDAVSMLAGFSRLGKDAHEVGRGCWQGKSFDGEATETIVLVGSKEAARLNGDAELRRVISPRVDNLLLDIGSDDDPWYEFEEIQKMIRTATESAAWRREAIAEATELFSRWRWGTKVCPELVTGLVLASWVQTLWKWRPLISLIGASKTGKTSLFQTLGGTEGSYGIFGSLAMLSSQSSEAGIRQAVSNTACVILLDEFEANRERQKMMNLFRTAGRGSKILRGTSGQKSQKYGLQHIPWVAATEVTMDHEPDRNRFIVMELLPPRAGEQGQLRIPDEQALRLLGQRLLATAVVSVRQAVHWAAVMRGMEYEGVDSRVVESYAVPAAVLAAAAGGESADALSALERLLGNVSTDGGRRDDMTDLICDLLSAVVDCGHGVKRSVAQIIGSPAEYLEFSGVLEMHGVCLVMGNRGRRPKEMDDAEKCLFVDYRAARRMLFRGQRWEQVAIEQFLLRLPGARQCRHTCGGKQAWGVRIPLDWIEEQFIDGDSMVRAESDDEGF